MKFLLPLFHRGDEIRRQFKNSEPLRSLREIKQKACELATDSHGLTQTKKYYTIFKFCKIGEVRWARK